MSQPQAPARPPAPRFTTRAHSPVFPYGIPSHATAAERFAAFDTSHPTVRIEELGRAGVVMASAEDPIWTLAREGDATALPPEILSLFLAVRNTNRDMFAAIEGSGEGFQMTSWQKDTGGAPQGGGVMSVHRGTVIEKAAVQMSVVWGDSYPSIEKDYSGKPFTAGGVSLIGHPSNPNAPIAHMNVRMLKVGEGAEAVTWIGGGGDLTPMVRFEEDTRDFHASFEKVCSRHANADHARFKEWCDEYFYIPHRGDTRGVGGIFFDYVKVGDTCECELLLDLGQAFARTYGAILARRVEMPYDDELKERQLRWRGRYAEFNLVYDRGTRFGLMSGGNPEAILASLPPVVKW